MLSEFDLIARIRARAGTRADVVLGIGDDAALLRVPSGHELAVTSDTLNAGVHFFDDVPPFDLGWKALAVNLSDLAAMGARPAWCTLALSLPAADPAWLDAFVDGFATLAREHEVALVGGDTTRGPLSINVTAHGLVEAGTALRRDGARRGDAVWITGAPGEAAAGLALLRAEREGRPAEATDADGRAHLLVRLQRPLPRIAAGRALRGLASACLDVSDGLLADLGHIAAASGVGAEIDAGALPVPAALAALAPAVRLRHQFTGGDDYELCFTAPADADAAVHAALAPTGVAATRIGRVVAGGGVAVRDPHGHYAASPHAGFDHFRP
ncbi:thiamine-phosphate kinase [Coralloluteibacterium stylophorae]|uniref:Thiamine-monophosphate kinase n=1 Tax=Coralloluteibacterium stylophorae TaxID=1776034 RepID=A0A8J7VUD0_9GAMM|nr:thiamine-phosphate kinase [Coralloluteibacterium stylophorae]MBS7457756.1 thiamine-phosphate kinase [Coralloluteibacterium stylophorae]